MAVSVTLNSVQQDASGRVRFRFSMPSGELDEREFASISDASQYARDRLTRNEAIAMGIALVLTRQPTLSNPSAFAGKTMTIDLTLANWGTVA